MSARNDDDSLKKLGCKVRQPRKVIRAQNGGNLRCPNLVGVAAGLSVAQRARGAAFVNYVAIQSITRTMYGPLLLQSSLTSSQARSTEIKQHPRSCKL